jgi:pimeloyl-ACP methyl ester carboxylesterase
MYKFLFLFVSVLLLVACSPYKDLTKMEFEDLKYPYPVKTAQLKDATIAYIDEGTGDNTIIFIHGLGSYLRAWDKNIPELSKKYRCIAIDLPGYGKSSKEIHPASMEFYADVVAEFINKLKLKNVTLAGHSMGGQISMVFSLKYPEMLKNLILVDPAGFEAFNEGEKQWFRDVMTVNAVKLTPVQTIRANLILNFYDMPEDAEFMITDRIALRDAKDFEKYCYTVAKSVHGMVDQPVINLIDRINVPTLIVFGENDNLIPNPYLHGGKTEDIAKIGHEKIKGSKLVMIPECGHFAQYEKYQEFNNAVLDFLK